jgi:CheY-like chemotaxis protein
MQKANKRVHLICWKDDRAAELRDLLEEAGWMVDSTPFQMSTLKSLAAAPPDAVVIDLGRLPAQGRDVGVALRTRAGTRDIPIVFVDGAEEKIARTRDLLPDAAYLTRDEMAMALPRALAEAPAAPVVPASTLAGYSGTPLPKKLGVKRGSVVALVNAPSDFASTLGELPDDVKVHDGTQPDATVTLWFVRSQNALEESIASMARIRKGGRLWICWPKKASGVTTDVTQQAVRSTGLAAGIVDFKICAIDGTWSGLCFANRKA